jgi:hypothetical protein
MGKRIETFHVPRSDGKFFVGELTSPQSVSVREFPPEGSKRLDASVFEQVMGSPDDIRKAVLGEPNPLRKLVEAVHLKPSGMKRSFDLINQVGSQIEAWRAEGRPDSLQTMSVITPTALFNVRSSVMALGAHLNSNGAKQAYVNANDEQRAELRAKLSALGRTLEDISDVESVGGQLNDLLQGLADIDTFMSQMGTGQKLTYQHSVTGEVALLLGTVKKETTQLFVIFRDTPT